MSRSSGLAGRPSALTISGAMSAGKNGLTVAPEGDRLWLDEPTRLV